MRVNLYLNVRTDRNVGAYVSVKARVSLGVSLPAALTVSAYCCTGISVSMCFCLTVCVHSSLILSVTMAASLNVGVEDRAAASRIVLSSVSLRAGVIVFLRVGLSIPPRN